MSVEGMSEVIGKGLFEFFMELIGEIARDLLTDKFCGRRSHGSLVSTRSTYRSSWKRRSGRDELIEVNKPAEILEMPDTLTIVMDNSPQRMNTVRLKALLGIDERVKCVQIIKGVSGKCSRLAVEAAKKIRFRPAHEGNLLISQWIKLDYLCG